MNTSLQVVKTHQGSLKQETIRKVGSANTEVDLPSQSLPRPDIFICGIARSIEVDEIEIQFSNPEWLYSNESIDVKFASPGREEWFDFNPRYNVVQLV